MDVSLRWGWLGSVGLVLYAGACSPNGQQSDPDGEQPTSSSDGGSGDPSAGTAESTDADPTNADGSGSGDGTGSPTGTPLEVCVEDSVIDFTCEPAPRTETAVAGQDIPCLAASGGDAQLFLTFELDAAQRDGTLFLLEARLQPPGWSTTNDGDRWVVTFDEPVSVAPGQTLPAVLHGTAVLDTFTIAAAFSFLEGRLDDAEITLTDPPTWEALDRGTSIVGTVVGTGGEFLVFDGTNDSPDPRDDYEWIVDPTVEASGCFATMATMHPLELGDP